MKTHEKALALCHAIEAAGASEALTNCSVLASELHKEIVAENSRLLRLAETMYRFASENYPEDKNGQVDFVRLLLEGYAKEIVNPSD